MEAKYDYKTKIFYRNLLLTLKEKDVEEEVRESIRENLLTLEEILQLLFSKKFNYQEIIDELMAKNQHWSYKKRRLGGMIQ